MRTRSTIAGASLALAVAVPAAAQPAAMQGDPGAQRPDVPVLQETRVYRGTVREIDPAARVLVIEGENGGTSTMRLGAGVRNFDNVRVGDRVSVRYTEAVAQAIVEEPGSSVRQRIEADAATQAPPGGRPGMQTIDRVTVVANVVAVDREHGRVTLRGTGREPVQLSVGDERMLSGLQPGDQVVATYLRSTAVAIESGDDRIPR